MSRHGTRIFSSLIGLCALAVLLQGVWAGIFLQHDGQRDAAGTWTDAHARGGELAVLLAALATLAALLWIRSRRDLCVGAGVLTVLLVLESYLGGLIRDNGKDTLTAVHVPLAMAIIGLVVWLSFRAARLRAAEPVRDPYPDAVRSRAGADRIT
jgi:hypothetical protein